MISYLYGKNVGWSLVKSQRKIHKMYLSESAFQHQWQAIVKEYGLAYEIVGKQRLDELSQQGNHQGVVIAVEEFVTCQLAELLATISPTDLALLVMLDSIEDPHNLGAILRSCDGAGAQGVIIGKHRRSPLNATVAKVSSGAIASVPVAEVTNLVMTAKQLKEKGYWIVGCSQEGQSLYQFTYDTPIALVIGAEGKGISHLLKKQCDYLISIPMAGQVASLNASVATAIALYQIQHQRSLLTK